MLLLLFHAVFTVERVHAPRVEEDQGQEDQDRTLLREPETKVSAAYFDTRQKRTQQDAEPERNQRPYPEADFD